MNSVILETMRGFYEGWYSEAYTDNVVIREGFAQIPAKPGLGTALRQELLSSGDVSVRVSALEK